MMSDWRKSSRSQGSDHCVEVRLTDDTVYIRDSKYLRDPANDRAAQPVIAIAAEDWPAFLDAASTQATTVVPSCLAIENHHDGAVTLRSAEAITLTYTDLEWHAFLARVQLGEFTPTGHRPAA